MPSDLLGIRVEWLDGLGITTPELAATWARYEIWVGEECLTEVVGARRDSTCRRSVFGSLYPLAEWVVANWWLLQEDVGPSRHPARSWTWPRVTEHDWLRRHNFRSAGEGMSWPDLTLVPEGGLTRLCWFRDEKPLLSGLRFASAGQAFLARREVTTGLADFVNAVAGRLAEQGIAKTPLAEDWAALGRLDQDEREFCVSAARLGLDPFAVTQEQEREIIAAAGAVPDEILDEFFPALWRADRLSMERIADAARWAQSATVTAAKATGEARESLTILRDAAQPRTKDPAGPPWRTGYAVAKRVRRALEIGDGQRLADLPWVGQRSPSTPSRDIEGIITVRADRVGMVAGNPQSSSETERFRQARALGRALINPDRTGYVLSRSGSSDEQAAHAFAAEMLAPATGIKAFLDDFSDPGDAIDQAARHFGVSSALVDRQIENQLLS